MGEYIMTIIWAVIFVGAIFLEAETAEMIAVWFMPGALISLVLSIFKVELWIQLVVFVVVSAILLVLAKTIFRKKLLKNVGQAKTDTDLIIGKAVKVEEDIVNSEEKGAVKVGGQIWSARMANGEETAVAGETVIIESISGVKLICKRS